jgi:hypothetical protein
VIAVYLIFNIQFKVKIMKAFFNLLLLSFFASAVSAQTATSKTSLPDPNKNIQTVDISCGKCKLGLPGKSCDLAVRIDGKAYYADGADIDSFGDAHAHNGLCNAVRKAEVQGELVDNRFKITYIKVVAEEKKKEGEN